jgi:transposase
MSQKSGSVKEPAEKVVQNIRRATRKRYSAEEKIRIVLEGLRGEDSIAALCRREGISQNLYYRWSKEFLEAGKKRLAGDTAREATSGEVTSLRRETGALKEVVAELMLENRLLKKSMTGQTLLAFAEETKDEVSRRRKAGNHPVGRAVPSAGEAHPFEARHPQHHLLPLVRSLPDRRS